MSRIIFVTTEYDPVLPGGAGTVVGELSRRLVSEGHEVVVLLAAETEELSGLGVDVRLVAPGDSDAEAPTEALAASRSVAEALAGLDPTEADVIEFTDFWGLAYWTLTRRSQLGLQDTRIGVRFHGPMDLIFDSVGIEFPPFDLQVETDAYRLADFVLVPSPAMGELVRDRYQVAAERIVVGELPVPPTERRSRNRSTTPSIVCYGTVAEVKGSHDFLEAVIPILHRRPDLVATFIGSDGWSISRSEPMTPILRSMTPSDLADRITFTGRVSRQDFADALSTAWVVVLPSRFESFCLSAHEVRRLGVPVVVPALPAFVQYFSEETGAVVYDGTVDDLTATLESLLDDPDRIERLACAPAPEVGDPLVPYREPLPPPRHPREQGGLAEWSVAALQRLAVPHPNWAFAGRSASAILRVLPAPVARLAVKVLPQKMKDRFRSVASWPEEAARREQTERIESVLAREGEFPDLAHPEVSVVIPCYNQGQYVLDAILSVFDQTFRSFEVIVVDDGSTDPATIAVLDAIDLPRTRLIRQENRGLPGARNTGMTAARGRYLVPLDADDELKPEFLEEMHRAIDSQPGAAYAHCWAELFGNTSMSYATRPWNPYWLLRANSVIGCVMMRRAAWAAVGGYDETLVGQPEDWELWLRFFKEGWDQIQVPKLLFRYRRHGVTLRVLGEINFEKGREALRQRHPDLFTDDALRRLRRDWYPLLTVVGPVNPLPDVAELVPSRGELATTWGKYVVDLSQTTKVDPDLLLMMARALEEDPNAGWVTTSAPAPLVMVRRWNLHDSFAEPRGMRIVDDPTPGSAGFDPGSIERTGWSIPGELREAEIPLHREKPEEDWPLTDLERSQRW